RPVCRTIFHLHNPPYLVVCGLPRRPCGRFVRDQRTRQAGHSGLSASQPYTLTFISVPSSSIHLGAIPSSCIREMMSRSSCGPSYCRPRRRYTSAQINDSCSHVETTLPSSLHFHGVIIGDTMVLHLQ